MKLAVLICCYNRKPTTLNCLHQLYQQRLPEDWQLDVHVLDDGSADGTYEAVAQQFPQVRLYRGTGSMYWNGAMRFLWQRVLPCRYDGYLWLNDDVALFPDALLRLLCCYLEQPEQHNIGALVGTVVEPGTDIPSYGGRCSESRWHPLAFGPLLHPADYPRPCDFINGNLCFIPQHVVNEAGITDERYTHALGDFDYGLRLKKTGFALLVAPGLFGECRSNSKTGSVFDRSLPLSRRRKMLDNPACFVPVSQWLYFVRRHGGLVWPLLWFKGLLRKLFPYVWLLLRADTHKPNGSEKTD
ncbi:glycosyltransferase family 2 protein [Lacimicrobium alkaliphilum]|uniref:Glycosyltransferase 2-like domain-containing protein n=1 Tax=Lacimicrobium alkaliphilum TaxID=1526571 RepID=A0ABQ1RNN5_9ALTE|nr:glycosyltransferase family 2 protein [Lacimicrobium alkaliphilum]GGD76671.1 hypothetical protein GCM10011357_34640 [Lacimicrobium alkaliphilum]